MGTRNLTLVKSKNEYKVAQYGQWDGSPQVGGINILNILRSLNLVEFRQKVDALVEISDEKLEKIWNDCKRKDPDMFARKSPHLHRDCGGDILGLIAFDKAKEVSLCVEFAGESLHCEWAYVVDFDKNTFEIYRGLNTKTLPVKARFKFLEKKTEKYKPVRIVAEWPLDNLPTADDLITLDAGVREREEAEREKSGAASDA